MGHSILPSVYFLSLILGVYPGRVVSLFEEASNCYLWLEIPASRNICLCSASSKKPAMTRSETLLTAYTGKVVGTQYSHYLTLHTVCT